MSDYNFWQDAFDTYQSLADWIKALWLIVPPAFTLGLVGLLLRHKANRHQPTKPDANPVDPAQGQGGRTIVR